MEINVIRSTSDSVIVRCVGGSLTNETEYVSEYLATIQYAKYDPFRQMLFFFFNRARLEGVLAKYNFGEVAEVRISVANFSDKLICGDAVKASMLQFNDFTLGRLVFEALKVKQMLIDISKAYPLAPNYGSPDFDQYVRIGALKRDLTEKESKLDSWKPKSSDYYAVYGKFIEDDDVVSDCVITDLGLGI